MIVLDFGPSVGPEKVKSAPGAAMQVTISDAKGLLTDLVRRVEGGEEVILTRHGQPVAKVVPITQRKIQEERRAVLRAVAEMARNRATPGPDAAHSQDFLYDESGLPA